MRSDKQLDDEVRRSESWSPPRGNDIDLLDSEVPLGMSLSGHERDCVFLNRQGDQFLNISGISGLDSVADGRTFVYFDYDRDGQTDIALTNNNTPQFQLFHNELGRTPPAEGSPTRFIAVRFVGGNNSALPTAEFTNRDGYGARVRVQAGELQQLREQRCGEGRAGQNSATMLIGLGQEPVAERVIVEWPTGRRQEVTSVEAGTLLTVYENPAEAPDGSGQHREPYVVEGTSLAAPSAKPATDTRLEWAAVGGVDAQPKLRMYTTMATWCAACKSHIPQLRHIRQMFDADSLAMFGVPIDESDTSEMLEGYQSRYAPGYDVLTELSDGQVDDVRSTVRAELKTDVLPATIVTDGDGTILATLASVPTVSQLRKWLREVSSPRVALELR